MSKVAVAHFGSGWVWLVQHNEAPFLLDVIDTHDAGCPLTRMPQVNRVEKKGEPMWMCHDGGVFS